MGEPPSWALFDSLYSPLSLLFLEGVHWSESPRGGRWPCAHTEHPVPRVPGQDTQSTRHRPGRDSGQDCTPGWSWGPAVPGGTWLVPPPSGHVLVFLTYHVCVSYTSEPD